MIGMIAGIPGSDFSLGLVQRLLGEKIAAQSSGTVSTSQTATGMMRFQRGLFNKRPTPTPSASVTTLTPSTSTAASAESASSSPDPASSYPEAASGSVEGTIYAAAAEFGLSGSYLVSVAECESHLNPRAYNSAGYYGLFQFDNTTWSAYGYGSVYDPVAQARTAARLIAAGQGSRWPNCA
jgi:soluble lytic murein transglycosylase-like protein